MAQTSGLFNSTETIQKKYQDIHFAQMMSFFVGQSGYIPNFKNELQVVAAEADRTVTLKSGGAWLGDPCGWWYENDEDVSFGFSDPGTGQQAQYRIILRLDRETNLQVSAQVLGPTSIDLTQSENLYEISLVKVTVNGDDTSVVIEDERVPCIRSSSGIAEKSDAWTLSLTDMNKFIKCTNTAAINVTIPANNAVAFPVNTELVICQYSAYPVTAVPDSSSGVVLRALDSSYTSDGQYSAFTLRKIGEDEWIAVGALTS